LIGRQPVALQDGSPSRGQARDGLGTSRSSTGVRGSEQDQQDRWFSDPGWYGVIPVVSLLSVIAGACMVLAAWTQERPDEVFPGIVVVVLAIVIMVWGMSRRSPALGVLVAVGFLVQLVALSWYYYTGFAVDANTYHRAAVRALEGDAQFKWEQGNWANWVTASLTASLYRVTGVSQLMGFVAFSLVGLLAKTIFAHTMLRMHALFGRAADGAAVGVMLFPSLALWLSPIGKEAFAVLGVALVIAALVRPVGNRIGTWLMLLGLASAALTRPHVSLLLAISALAYAAAILASRYQSLPRRMALLVAVVVLGYSSLMVASSYFDVEPTAAGLEDVRIDLAEQRPAGGSTIETRPVQGLTDIPIATANVLLRPHLGEAQSWSQMLQALEATILGMALLWLALQFHRRGQNVVRGFAAHHLRAVRAFAWSYVILFIYSFSGMYNLGLMSRQRTQLTLVLLLLGASALTTRRQRRQGSRGPMLEPSSPRNPAMKSPVTPRRQRPSVSRP
jgi:hypothetical protein